MSHLAVMVTGVGQLFTAGPPVVLGGTGENLTKEELGGAAVHRGNGTIERFAGTERFSFHRADIVRETLPGGPVDVLFQLASPASPIAYAPLPIETLEANAMGTRR